MNTPIVRSEETRELIVPGDYQTTIQYCVENFKIAARHAIKKHGSFCVALSGGETPRAILQQLASDKSLPWESIYLFWSDERCVPPNNPASNYRMVVETGLIGLIKPENIHRMRGEDDPVKEAVRYEKLLKETLPNGVFDLMTLGIGEDGHTASLFPDTEALNVYDKLVTANYVPQKDTWRLTLTFPCINQSKQIVVYVSGERKSNILKKIFDGNDPLPAKKVGTAQHKAKFIADQAAAKSLLETNY